MLPPVPVGNASSLRIDTDDRSRLSAAPTTDSMATNDRSLPVPYEPVAPDRVTRALLDFVSRIPAAEVGPSADPLADARALGQRAARRAAVTAGSLALPPGPLGWMTVLPELIAIWRIQAQMVSDIAASFGSVGAACASEASSSSLLPRLSM